MKPLGGRAAAEWGQSLLVYVAFAAAIYLIQGDKPLLGSDHLSYMLLADSMISACPAGDFWRETSSVHTFGVMLATLHGWTGSHVVSMKLVLAFFTVLYLLAAELFFRLFATRWRAVLFALVSAFAVSFGVASWGVTDSTALLPRTLAAPVVMIAFWWWFRFDGKPVKYLAFAFLILGSILHLSTFFAIAALALLEVIDWMVLRRFRVDLMVPAFVVGLAVAVGLQFVLEHEGLSTKALGIQVPEMMRAVGVKVENIEFPDAGACHKSPRIEATAVAVEPAPPKSKPEPVQPAPAPDPPPAPTPAPTPAKTVAPAPAPATVSAPPPAPPGPPPPSSRVRNPVPEAASAPAPTAEQAWATELSLRPWRNMPLPLVNVANILSSSALILVLAFAGMVSAWRAGLTRSDKLMLALFAAVVLFSFGPQTLVWIVRSMHPIHPVNLEEIRTLSLIMIPSLYFILRLFTRVADGGGPRVRWKAAGIVAGVLVLPLLMKGLPVWVRESVLATMTATHMVDARSESALANARVALGLGARRAPFYYATEGVRGWLAKNAAPGARVLTDRDDLVLLRDVVLVGPRQVGATSYYPTQALTDVYLQTSGAIERGDLVRVKKLAKALDVDYAVVPWRVESAPFVDNDFSVIALGSS
jgi:hypothetical protein